MRDKPIHDYMGVDMTAVWHTATTDVPVLQQQIEKILARLNSDLHQVFNVVRLTHGPAA